MPTFEEFIATELPKRPFTEADGESGQVLARSGNVTHPLELVWADMPGVVVPETVTAGIDLSGNRMVVLDSSRNAIYADSNANNNAFVIRWANGHTFSIGHAAESGIVMQTEKGHVIQLDENSTEIRIKTHTGQSQIVISDTGDITVTNTGNTTINTKGNVDINAQAAINLVAQAGVNLSSAGGSPTIVKSSGPMTVMSPKISLRGM